MLHNDFFVFCSISEIRIQQEILLKSMMEFSNGKVFYTDSEDATLTDNSITFLRI